MSKSSRTTPPSASGNDPFLALAQASGNSFHGEVAEHLRRRDWEVLLSPYYVDNATGKAREVDLLCEKLWEFRSDLDPRRSRLFRVQLLVECKYIPTESSTVFWFDEWDGGSAHKLVIENIPHLKNKSLLRDHHYFSHGSTNVAKLFASEPKRGEDKEPIYMALNQCLGALIQLGGIPTRTVQQASDVEATITSRYPVIICSSFDRFRRTDLQGVPPSLIENNFLMEVNYAFTNSANRPLHKYALIDVVSRQLLDSFLQHLEREADAVKLVFGY